MDSRTCDHCGRAYFARYGACPDAPWHRYFPGHEVVNGPPGISFRGVHYGGYFIHKWPAAGGDMSVKCSRVFARKGGGWRLRWESPPGTDDEAGAQAKQYLDFLRADP